MFPLSFGKPLFFIWRKTQLNSTRMMKKKEVKPPRDLPYSRQLAEALADMAIAVAKLKKEEQRGLKK